MLKIKNSSTNQDYYLDQKKITIYNCGPTVYNDVHIGNIRPLITVDVLYRYLSFTNHEVYYVQNITDIDDKIINRARELKQSELELSQHYYEEYLKLLDILNIKKINLMPKVSDNIPGIIKFIEKLIKTNHAYVADGDVYFDIKSIDGYGSVSHQKIENLLNGVRINPDEKKNFALDFVLWKKTKVGINWPTKWNDHGRPGWHTECVYLINKYIGEQVDLHVGGVDLKFPHHENENAQNLAYNRVPLAKCWMHIGHINVNGEKMSKSLNNFTFVKDVLKKYNANVIRWFIYQTRYQGPLNYSNEMLDTAQNDWTKFIKNYNLGLINYYWLTNKKKVNHIKTLPTPFIQAIEDDLNFPNVMQQLWEVNKQLSNSSRTKNIEAIQLQLNDLNNMLDILGFQVKNILEDGKVKHLVDEWKQEIENKNYKKADQLRAQLQKLDLI